VLARIARLSSGATTAPGQHPADKALAEQLNKALPALLIEVTQALASLEVRQGDSLQANAVAILKGIVTEWKTPTFSALLAEIPSPGAPLRLVYGESGYTHLDWELRIAEPGKSLLSANAPDSKDASGWGNVVAAGSLAFNAPNSLAFTTTTQPLVPNCPPGILQLTVTPRGKVDGAPVHLPFLCTRLSATLITASVQGAPMELWLEDLQSRKPLADTPVTLLVSHPSQGEVSPQHPDDDEDGPLVLYEIKDQRTDSEGRLRLPTDVTKLPRIAGIAVVAKGLTAILKQPVFRPRPRSEAWTGDVFVERPLFRPGETVHWRVILRRQTPVGWEIPSGKCRVIVSDEDWNKVLQDHNNVDIDDTGCLAGELQLPEDMRPGRLMVFVTSPGTDAPAKLRPRDMLTYGDLCQVDRHLTPPASVSLALENSNQEIIVGDPRLLKLKCAWLSGGAIVGANASVTLSASLMQDKASDALQKWANELSQHPHSCTTDLDGIGTIPLRIPDSILSPIVLRVDGSVTIPGSPAMEIHERFVLSGSGLVAYWPAQATRQVEAGERIPLEAQILDGNGKPVDTDLVAELYALTWQELWQSKDGTVVKNRPEGLRVPSPDETGRRRVGDWECLKAADDAELLYRTTLHVQNGRFLRGILIPKLGRYAVKFIIKNNGLLGSLEEGYITLEQRDAAARSRREIPSLNELGNAPDETGMELYGVEGDKVIPGLCPDRAIMALGPPPSTESSPRLMLIVPPQGYANSLAFISGSHSFSSQRISGPGQPTVIQIKRPQFSDSTCRVELLPIGAHDTDLNGGRPYLSVSFPESQHAFGLTLEGPAGSVEPGSKVALDVRSGSSTGSPVSARVMLAVTDDALTTLIGAPQEREQPFFDRARSPIRAHRRSSSDRDHSIYGYSDPTRDNRIVLNGDMSQSGSEEELIDLSPFCVSSDSSEGYQVPLSLAGTRLRTDLVEPSQHPRPPTLEDLANAAMAPSRLRRHFASTALWAPDLRSDSKGKASIRFQLPDNLTRWKVRAYALSLDGREFATASTTFEASLPFQARLQAPRLLVKGDQLDLTALLVNRTGSGLIATHTLSLQGPLVASQATTLTGAHQVGAENHVSLTWPLLARGVGEAVLTLKASTPRASDELEGRIPVVDDGALLPLGGSLYLSPKADSATAELHLPTGQPASRTQLSLILSPTIADSLTRALPRLIQYPYGCVEQTMSRFMPAAILRQLMGESGVSATAFEQALRGNKDIPAEEAVRIHNLDTIIAAGLARLEDASREDGSYGWWPGSPTADLWMTSYVKWGFSVAHNNRLQLPERQASKLSNLDAAVTRYLLSALAKAPHLLDAGTLAWALSALTLDQSLEPKTLTPLRLAFESAFTRRAKFTPRELACLAIASYRLGTPEQRELLLRNLLNGSEKLGGTGDTQMLRWSVGSWRMLAEDDPVETTALVVTALQLLAPNAEEIRQATSYLATQCQASPNLNTRALSLAILTLARQVQREQTIHSEYALWVNGKFIANTRVDSRGILGENTRLEVPEAALKPGLNAIRIGRVSGHAPVWATIQGTAWYSADDVPVPGEGARVALVRSLLEYKTVETQEGMSIVETLPVLSSRPITRGSQLLLQVAIKIDSPANYLMLSLPKAAGTEPFHTLSGYDTLLTATRPAEHEAFINGTKPPPPSLPKPTQRVCFREEYDDRSVVYLDHLDTGTYILTLPLQAVHAGDFRLLPATIECMYVPAIRANTAASRLRIAK